MFYDDKFYMQTLKFDDVFTSASQFISEVVSVGGITLTASLTELYQILSMKYVRNYTRYTDKFAFIMAIKRELYTEFPFYLKKKELADEFMAIEIADVQLSQNQLRNLVDQHDEDMTNADTIAFDELSTQQENVRFTIGKLDAIKQKYGVMNRNFLQGIYKRCDELFRVILAEDGIPIYDQGDEE